MPDVYLSHASRDSQAARQIADALEREGVTCFLAPRDIAVGVEYGTAILSAITSSRVLVVLLSESANQSRQVEREVQTAANNGLPIIPYRIEDVSPRGSLEYFLSSIQWIEGFEPHGIEGLVKAVRSTLTSASPEIAPSAPSAVPSVWQRLKEKLTIAPRPAPASAPISKPVRDDTADAARLASQLMFHRLEDVGGVTFPRGLRSALGSLIDDLPERLERVAQEATQTQRLQDPGRQIEATESALRTLSALKSELLPKSGLMAEAVAEILENWSTLFSTARREAVQRVEEHREIENPFIVGNPVRSLESNLFTGRRDIALEIERTLVRAAQAPTLLLYGQRRMGKTSILYQLPSLLGPGFLPVLVDCQAPATVESQAALLRHVSRCLASALDVRLRVERSDEAARRSRSVMDLTRDALQQDPYSVFEDWLDMFQSRLPDNTRVLLCLDEFERLREIVNNGWGTRFLDALRHWLQHRPRFALMFVGSSTFEQLGPEWTDRFISARRLKVSFLAEQDVRQLLTKPTPTFNLTYAPGTIDAIRDATSGQPFLTQVLAWELVGYMNRQGRKHATPADVAIAVTDALESSAEYFVDMWSSRSDAQQAILREVARGTRRPPTSAVARELFDYDLLNSKGDFAVPMVGRWVREHHLAYP